MIQSWLVRSPNGQVFTLDNGTPSDLVFFFHSFAPRLVQFQANRRQKAKGLIKL